MIPPFLTQLTVLRDLGVPPQSPPPPSPYSSHQMPPSTSTPIMHLQRESTNQVPRNVLPPPLAFEGQGTPYRPGIGMSISAMLGADMRSSRDHRPDEHDAQSRPASTPSLPLARSSPGGAGNEQSQEHSTLDRYKSWFPENSRTPHTHSSTLPPRPFSDNHTESPRFGSPLQPSSGRSPPRPIPFPGPPSSSDPANSSMRKYSLSDPKPLDSGRIFGPRFGGKEERPRVIDPRPVARAHPDDDMRPALQREPREDGEKFFKAYLAPKRLEDRDFVLDAATSSPYPFLSRNSHASKFDHPALPPDKATLNRAVETSYPRQGTLPAAPNFESRRVSHEPAVAALRSLHEPRRTSIPMPDSPEQIRDSPLSHLQRQLVASAAGADDGSSSPEMSRKSLSLLNDNKRGRVSPLPQAVQGAQAQLRGPASEPGIKNEFARMFSGIGSGVGSAVSTPVPPDTQPLGLPSSPLGLEEVDRRTPLNKRKELMEDSKPRNASRPGRRSRKAKGNEIKTENDANGAGLAHQTFSGRGQKRTRNNYQNVSGNLTQR